MNLLLKGVLPLLLLIGGVFAARFISSSAEEPQQRARPAPVATVEATRLTTEPYQVTLNSQGTVSPTRQNALVPDIAGTVSELSADFEIGARFEQGDVLLQLDPRDYELALVQAEAAVAQAEASLQQEQAEADIAAKDWNSLGRRGTPSDLTLRKPQIAAARANLKSAEAQRARAQLDLDRTVVRAPYAGRVLERNVNNGEFVNRGAEVGRIHALDAVDIRLPLNERQLSMLDLQSIGTDNPEAPVVTLSTLQDGTRQRWVGRLVRVEGLDETTQQLYVIARVEHPYADPAKPLRVGQFVEAEIQARRFDEVFVIPRVALGIRGEVVLLEGTDTLRRVPVEPVWVDDRQAVIVNGLRADQVLVTTPVGTLGDQTRVRAIIDGEAPLEPSGGSGRGSGQAKGERATGSG